MPRLTPYKSEDLYPHKKVLSSSQFSDYEKDPAKFFSDWCLLKREPSVPMLVGSIFSELFRNRDFDYRSALLEIGAKKHIADLFGNIISKFPKVPAEVEVRAEYKGWGFRATLDGYVS